MTARYDPLRPLYLIALGDDAGTKLYVSSRSGEITLDIPTIAAKLPTLQFGATEARFVWLDGSPMIIVASRDGTQTPLDVASGEFAKLSQDRLWTAAAKLLPHAHITERLTLKEYDAYWYAHHHDRELPVLRAVFDDDAKTWFHISPVTGDIIGRVDSSRRTYRWLFNALHSFDFQLFLMYRPAWDIVVWLLSILGAIVSVSGVVIGWRYLRG